MYKNNTVKQIMIAVVSGLVVGLIIYLSTIIRNEANIKNMNLKIDTLTEANNKLENGINAIYNRIAKYHSDTSLPPTAKANPSLEVNDKKGAYAVNPKKPKNKFNDPS